MENFRNVKAIQQKAVAQWIEIVRAAMRHGPEPGETISPATVALRMQFCEAMASALQRLVKEDGSDENALLYALIAMSQIYGMWVALSAEYGPGFKEIIDAGKHMILAFQASLADADRPVAEAVH